jgi:prephenate dehydrogenase
VTDADLILLAVPVTATEACFKVIAPALKPDALLMDVGSTKSDIVAAAIRTLGDKLHCFVPVHPIAGKEVAGVEHSDADLYKDRALIVTPMASSGATQVEQAKQIWKSLGSYITELTPAAHDAAFAAVSHLPHLLAFAMMQSLHGQDQGEQFMALAGSGFRDFTRIAASEPAMWRDILLANRDELLAQSRHFQDSLQALEQLITNGDAAQLHSAITQASEARTRWAQSSGPSSPHQD